MKVKSSVKISEKDKKKGLFCKVRRNKRGVRRVYKLQHGRKKNGRGSGKDKMRQG